MCSGGLRILFSSMRLLVLLGSQLSVCQAWRRTRACWLVCRWVEEPQRVGHIQFVGV